ncbi:MAG: GlcNAc transferase [Planctomycetaceae bacterium]|nr:GlcNAc transferase [Planctomycetaceae bacterium]
MTEHDAQSGQPEVSSDSPCLQGESVTFTGTLASMTHQQACEHVEQRGGTATPHASRATTMLVIGEEGWPLETDGRESVKLQQVTQWQHEGIGVRIVTESDWLYLIGLRDKETDAVRLYTPAMLSQMLGLSVSLIRRWDRIGLIQPVKRVFRLPYFDFEEVANARRLTELLEAGVSRTEVEKSLTNLAPHLGTGDRSLTQLEILTRDAHIVVRDDRGLLEPASGQRVFDFEPTETGSTDDARDTISLTEPVETEPDFDSFTADDWYVQGCQLLDDSEADAAAEAFRLCLMERSQDAEASFHLAEALYRVGNLEGALERYHVAVEVDNEYIEAWTQLGCLHSEAGRPTAALEAFEIALRIHPEFPDALLHKADVLTQLGRETEAIPLWQAYLQYDQQGPWAGVARQKLEDAEGT